MSGNLDFEHLGDIIATYSGGPSLVGVPAGARKEGKEFERAVAEAWTTFATKVSSVAVIHDVLPARSGQSAAIKIQSTGGPWAIYLRHSADLASLASSQAREEVPPDWVERTFTVSEILSSHLGEGPYSFAPPTALDSRRYHTDRYPLMYEGKTTSFDYAGALVESGELREKLLFEYKYAKSTTGNSVDGNAHERLSFQILQYVEIARLYPSCSLNVIGAQAFSEYRNKYHPSFNQQAVLLNRVFQQVQFRFCSCRSEYIALFRSLANFLLDGSLPAVNFRKGELTAPPCEADPPCSRD